MPSKVFLDSNVFLFAFERPESNSHRVLGILVERELLGVVTDRVVREVMGYFRRRYGKDLAGRFRDLILLTCEFVLEQDLRIPQEIVELVGPRDAGAVAAARALGLARLVFTGQDFAGVLERRTPREFLRDLGESPRPGDE
jgi:predicted nucleic acid-binding protein